MEGGRAGRKEREKEREGRLLGREREGTRTQGKKQRTRERISDIKREKFINVCGKEEGKGKWKKKRKGHVKNINNGVG